MVDLKEWKESVPDDGGCQDGSLRDKKPFAQLPFAPWRRPRCISLKREIIIMLPHAPGHSTEHTPLLLKTSNQPEDYVDMRCTLA